MPTPAQSPFNWQGQPSIVADDPDFRATRSGLTQAQACSAAGSGVVKRHIERTGRSPGTIPGLLRAERLQDIKPVGYRGRG